MKNFSYSIPVELKASFNWNSVICEDYTVISSLDRHYCSKNKILISISPPYWKKRNQIFITSKLLTFECFTFETIIHKAITINFNLL